MAANKFWLKRNKIPYTWMDVTYHIKNILCIYVAD